MCKRHLILLTRKIYLNKLIYLLISLSGLIPIFLTYTTFAQSLDTKATSFCSTLINKDIASIHTRSLLMPFFLTEDDLSNFVVYMNINMQRAGFKSTTVSGCKVKMIEANGLNAEVEYEITGKGPIFFLKRHMSISTIWLNKDGQWYIESPSTINMEDALLK